jgi:hypothetical protein
MLTSLCSVVDVAGPEKTQMDPVVEFIPAFAALWQGQPIKCLSTQRIFEGLPRPSLAIVDVRGIFLTKASRAVKS